MEQKTIGSFIATLRKAKGLTQKQLAEMLGVSDKTISHWERDESAPDLSILPVIADIFSVSCDELLRGEKRNCVQESTEDFSKKSEKQIKYIIEKALSKHKKLAIISGAVALIGFIVGYGIVIARFFAAFAAPVAFVYYIVAAVIIAVSHTQFTSKLQGDEFDSKLLQSNKLKANKISFYSAAFIIFIAVSSAPFLWGYTSTLPGWVFEISLTASLLFVLSFLMFVLKLKGILPSKLSAKQLKIILVLIVFLIIAFIIGIDFIKEILSIVD